MKKRQPKLIKNKCEIAECNVTQEAALHLHHIIERTDINCTNDNFNLAILCAVHHELLHDGQLKIIGVYPATVKPNNRILVYELNGVKNIDLDAPYVEIKPIKYDI